MVVHVADCLAVYYAVVKIRGWEFEGYEEHHFNTSG